MNTYLANNEMMRKFKTGQTILEDAPPPDEDIVRLLLKRLGVESSVAIEFQYDEGEKVNLRWKGYRTETVAILAEDNVPYWYPWIQRVMEHPEITKTVDAGLYVPTYGEQSPFQAVIRWRIWKPGKAHSDGFLEIILEPDPKKTFRWRERFIMNTFTSEINVGSLKDLYSAARAKQIVGRTPYFRSREAFLREAKQAYLRAKTFKLRPSQLDIASAMSIEGILGMSPSAFQKNLKNWGLTWPELKKILQTNNT